MPAELPPDLTEALDLHQKGHVSDAADRYRVILQQRPDDANALHLLGVTELQQKRPGEAVTLIAQAIALAPTQATYHLNYAEALRAVGRVDDAIEFAERAIEMDSSCAAMGYHIAGHAFLDGGQPEDAIYCWQRALEHNPKSLDTHVALARAHRDAGDLRAAVGGFRAAVDLAPGNALLRHELALALRKQGDKTGALAELDTALKLDPTMNFARVTRGFTLGEMMRHQEAIDAFNAALAAGSDAAAHLGLAAIHARRGELDQAIEHHRKAVELDPKNASQHSALLLTLHYSEAVTQQELFAEHRRWAAQHADALSARIEPHTNDRNPDRPLRIGFVSADFCGHPVSRFIEAVLPNCDRANFTFVCYSATKTPDAITARLREYAGEWHDVVALSDEQLAAKVRADQIDILVDLAGHTARNRLLTFARKPAPIQCTQFGYPDTTGLSTIDYRMTDALSDPVGANDVFYTEQLARLPIAWCYAPPRETPPVQLRRAKDATKPNETTHSGINRDGSYLIPPIAEEINSSRPYFSSDRASIVFGSVNNFIKITPAMLKVWQRILDATPGSTLVLLTQSHETAHTAKLLRERGMDLSRVTILPPLLQPAYLDLFGRIDIALDPFPYNGGVTTCDTVCMGVPLVTLAGGSYASRQGLSLLTRVGLADLIATTPDEYVRIATALAADRARLQSLRTTLREATRSSLICNAPAFTNALQNFYRQAWRKWCAEG